MPVLHVQAREVTHCKHTSVDSQHALSSCPQANTLVVYEKSFSEEQYKDFPDICYERNREQYP
eukprot:2299634-Heterocapsa_arctica.AAC.1